jgi:hypothetical protein
MPESLVLALESDRPAAQVAELSRELMNDLSRIDGVEVAARRAAPRPGDRGVLGPALGEFLVTVVGGGAGSVLLACLGSYFNREKKLVVRVRRADGAEMTIEAGHLKAERAEALMQQFETFVQGAAAPRVASPDRES